MTPIVVLLVLPQHGAYDAHGRDVIPSRLFEKVRLEDHRGCRDWLRRDSC